MFDDIDWSNPETSAALEEKGFISKEAAQQMVAAENKNLEDNRNSILEQYKDVRDKLNGLPISPEKIAELSKDGRFKKVVENGFDKYDKSVSGETGGQIEAVKTEKMMLEQDFRQKERKFEEDLKNATNENRNLRVENGLQMTLNKFNDQIFMSAVDDIKSRAKSELDIDEKGRLIVRGEDGLPRMTADGPMTPDDWIKDLKKSCSHYFKGPNGAAHNPMMTGDQDTSNMTAKEKLAFAMNQSSNR